MDTLHFLLSPKLLIGWVLTSSPLCWEWPFLVSKLGSAFTSSRKLQPGLRSGQDSSVLWTAVSFLPLGPCYHLAQITCLISSFVFSIHWYVQKTPLTHTQEPHHRIENHIFLSHACGRNAGPGQQKLGKLSLGSQMDRASAAAACWSWHPGGGCSASLSPGFLLCGEERHHH